MLNILNRTIKWRLAHPITIILSIIQPLIWLVIYGNTQQGTTINDNYIAYILPGLMVLVTFSCTSSSGMANYMMKQNRSFYRIQIAPIKKSQFVLGHVSESIILSFFSISILSIISLLMGVRIQLRIELLFIIVLITLTSFCFGNFAFLLSQSLPNSEIYYTLMNTIVLPLFFLSNALTPLEIINPKLQWVIRLNPFTMIISSLQEIILGNQIDISLMVKTSLLFIILCFITYVLALKSLNKDYFE